MRKKSLAVTAAVATAFTGLAVPGSPVDATRYEPPARLYEVTVEITNIAPDAGTNQTPVWVGLHDGSFDLYDPDVPISAELERLAEDGNNTPIIDAFAASGAGVDTVGAGPSGPLAPGDSTTVTFSVIAERGTPQFLSYASMVLPSNDAFVANGNPEEHEIIDARGRFVGENFVVAGAEVLDAGSEVNDELPETTAFFGQSVPDTGTVEGGTVSLHQGFNPVGSGGILDDPRFAGADFTADGYDTIKVEVSARRVRTSAVTRLSGRHEVPANDSRARGVSLLRLEADGDIDWGIFATRIDNVVAAHIHLGSPEENGPVVAVLLDGPAGARNRLIEHGEVQPGELVGPGEGLTTAELWTMIQDGDAYVNVHSTDFPGGEVRGNL